MSAEKKTMKILKVYLQVIPEAFERFWTLTLEQNTTERTTNDSAGFDDFDSSFLQPSEEDNYSRLIGKLFLKECFVDLLLIHLSESSHSLAVGGALKNLSKLASLVAQMLSKFVWNLVNRFPVENKQRVLISERYSERLFALLEDFECKDFVCRADFVDVVSSFVPLLSSSVLLRLVVVLLQSPEDCVQQLEHGPRTLSYRGKLIVCVLPWIFDRADSVQPEVLPGIGEGLCAVLKLVPSDEVFCDSLTSVAKRTPLFASDVTQGTVSVLLKAGTRPSLNLMMALAADSENCKQLLIGWFAVHKTWSGAQSLPLYVGAALFVLKACDKGLALNSFFTCCIFAQYSKYNSTCSIGSKVTNSATYFIFFGLECSDFQFPAW